MDRDDENDPEYFAEDDGDVHDDAADHDMDDDADEPSSLDHTSLEFSTSAPAAEIRDFCLSKFRTMDFIMEPSLMEFLNRYFASDGDAASAIEALSTSYEGLAQYVNLFAEWLIILGDEPTKVKELIENYMENILVSSFDPRKADRIFLQEGGNTHWLNDLIQHKHWRKMIYKLVETHGESLMLNFTIKLIADAGHQNEIPTTITAVSQTDVFTRVFDSAMGRLIDRQENALLDFARLVANGESTFLVAQLVMYSLAYEAPGGLNLMRIMQDVSDSVKNQHILHILLIIARGAAWPRAMQAVASMSSKKSLNPADIHILHQMYIIANPADSLGPPPVALLRFRDFLDLLVESLFSLESKIPSDHRIRYISLLAYAASVVEKWTTPSKKSPIPMRLEINRDDVKVTQEMIRKALEFIAKGPNDIHTELQNIFTVLRFPVISMGMIRWIGKTVKQASYFKFAGESRNTPVHLIILDEIASLHPYLHEKILDLLMELFETAWPQMDMLIRLELQKMFLDRMIHLVSCGCVLPVLRFVRAAYAKQDTDVSLFRHFVVELVDIMAPPYSDELMQLLLPLVSDKDITGTLRTADGKDSISVFLQDCKAST
ncbi:negative elongation factor D-like [Paramacrobiotus metropolitanus]|uniref:negative elongation factor D-like n=1 Tax=Paramacrobiotus metropolitanus TaxID=2943436 RepID=UPI002445B870|nr:negative elongation factor D-like [Paramacrobiotus metropolitanus]